MYIYIYVLLFLIWCICHPEENVLMFFLLYLLLQLFFKTKGVVNEDAYILFVRKNAIVVLIPKYGLEGTVFFEEKDKPIPRLDYNNEVGFVMFINCLFFLIW